MSPSLSAWLPWCSHTHRDGQKRDKTSSKVLEGREGTALFHGNGSQLSPEETSGAPALLNSCRDAVRIFYHKKNPQKPSTRPNPTNYKPFSFLLKPISPLKRNSLMSCPLSCVPTSGHCLLSEMSQPKGKSMFLCYFKRNYSLPRPIIAIRSPSFHTDSATNHQTQTHPSSLKGLALNLAWMGSEAPLHNRTWTPEQSTLTRLWKQIKQPQEWDVLPGFWTLGFYHNLSLYTQNKGGKVRLNCPGKRKKTALKLELGDGGRLMPDLHNASPPPVWRAFLMAHPFNPSDCNCQHVKSATCANHF